MSSPATRINKWCGLSGGFHMLHIQRSWRLAVDLQKDLARLNGSARHGTKFNMKVFLYSICIKHKSAQDLQSHRHF